MCLRSLSCVFAILFILPVAVEARELRVCADPNNLPFSDERGEGFENKIVELVAHELGASVSYFWHAQRRGFLRETLNAGACDLVPGFPKNAGGVRTTSPYYRSSYVFVTRQYGPIVSSFEDPSLGDYRIGVQLIGDDGWNTPPAHVLAEHGLVNNIRGYPVYGDYRESSPPSRIIKAVAEGEIDIALAWGPLAGFFASRQPLPLRVTPVQAAADAPQLPMAWDIAMAVRKDDVALGEEIDHALHRLGAEIDAILRDYGVPRTEEASR